jgi:hypothetical protein
MKEPPCPTHHLVLAAIVVVLDVQPLTGSAWNIARSAIVSTTVNDVQILSVTTASTTRRRGGAFGRRSLQLIRCARRVLLKSSRQRSLITEHRSSTVEQHSIGTIFSRSADRVIAARALRKDRDGTTGRDTGGDVINPS